MKFQVVVAGVGGQGVVLAARVLSEAAAAEGLMVYMGELHGMAQRGGSVLCTVRMGDVWGPLIKPGEADAMVALELAEALRYRGYLSETGTAVVSTRRIPPVTVATGQCRYPSTEEALAALRSAAGTVISLDALAIARSCGLARAENMVLLGALVATGRLPVRAESLRQAIERLVPPRALDANRQAFARGQHAARAALAGHAAREGSRA